MQRRYEETRQLVDKMQTELEATRSSLAEESRVAKIAAESKAEVFAQVAQLRVQNSSLEEKLAAAMLQMSTMVPQDDYNKAKSEARESRTLSSSLHDCVTLLDGEVDSLKAQLKNAQSKITQLEDGAIDLVSRSVLLDAQAEGKVWKSECQTRRTEVETLQEEIRRLKSQVQQQSLEISRAEEATIAKEADLQHLRADIVRKNREMADLTDAVSQLQQEGKKSEATSLEARDELLRAKDTHAQAISRMIPKEDAGLPSCISLILFASTLKTAIYHNVSCVSEQRCIAKRQRSSGRKSECSMLVLARCEKS